MQATTCAECHSALDKCHGRATKSGLPQYRWHGGMLRTAYVVVPCDRGNEVTKRTVAQINVLTHRPVHQMAGRFYFSTIARSRPPRNITCRPKTRSDGAIALATTHLHARLPPMPPGRNCMDSIVVPEEAKRRDGRCVSESPMYARNWSTALPIQQQHCDARTSISSAHPHRSRRG